MPLLVRSGCVLGVDGFVVSVEVDVLSLLPIFQIVGLPASSVRESRERVRSAIQASDLEFPRRRITVNLAPADHPKHGTALDLPIALAVVGASHRRPDGGLPWAEAPAALGELGLDGRVRPVRGVLPAVEAMVAAGATRVLVPRANAPEAAVVPGAVVLPVDNLRDAWAAARGGGQAFQGEAESVASDEPDLADVQGHEDARRLLEIAAAGGHGVLLEGPPGSGKSMLARRLASLLPSLDDRAALEVTRIRSAAGLLRSAGLTRRPPLRAPHHTASTVALVGGGSPPGPGEVTLAHRGVLLLDEAPEFSRAALETLRQPVEEGVVRLARASGVAQLPADFQLIATRNPCPCGRCDDQGRGLCSPAERQRYRRRLSGPLLDRIDLVGWVDPVPVRHLLTPTHGEASSSVRGRVEGARRRQQHRWRGEPWELNSRAPLSRCLQHFGGSSLATLQTVVEGCRSSRSVQQLARVSLTIADLTVRPPTAGDVLEAARRCGVSASPTGLTPSSEWCQGQLHG